MSQPVRGYYLDNIFWMVEGNAQNIVKIKMKLENAPPPLYLGKIWALLIPWVGPLPPRWSRGG